MPMNENEYYRFQARDTPTGVCGHRETYYELPCEQPSNYSGMCDGHLAAFRAELARYHTASAYGHDGPGHDAH
ncbi:hypothetical protein Q8F55_004242 [Vanrija albida]|uniref:Uncharacterized protein n=1 Tax=Vanrija albida TaxID=181172 RepID=A0ABR3Q6V1_9TREE